VPVRADGAEASLELYRATAFGEEERLAAGLVAAQAALVLRAFSGAPRGAAAAVLAEPALELAGEALAAALDDAHTGTEVVRVAAGVVGAPVGILWERTEEGRLAVAGSYGLDAAADVQPARAIAEETVAEAGPVRVVPAGALPGGCGVSTTLPLGQPPVGLLQLLFPQEAAPDDEQLARLTTFGIRAAQALRASAEARTLASELERTRALLAVVGQATARLSLAHTLETVVDRVAGLFGVEQVAVYLRTPAGPLEAAAGRGLAGPHLLVAERLLELALGSARGRDVVELVDPDRDLRDAAAAARGAGIGGALAVPLAVREEVIGLLAVYPPAWRHATENETALLAALAGQLAVAVQNAQLHERAMRLGAEREAALGAERAASRRLRALYEVSRSFAERLSLDATLDALAHTVVDVLDVDAAVILMPDERRELLVPRAMHVKDVQLADAAGAMLFRSEPFGAREVQRLFRTGRPVRGGRLDAGPGGGSAQLLRPFLDKGWTTALVPVAKPGEVIASLGIFSFRPGNPIADETVDAAVAIAGQAALAIDNARLYQQQKEFADTMQRSLLPRSRPDVEGLEVGEVYESSAHVDVGGDVYDFLRLDDGRLAVVLGDVTGHGVDATADMAMAKFVFRSLAREHPEPGDFLSAANEVVCGEIAPGKFITMAYLVVDGARGRVVCASAGHPAPRLVLPGGEVRRLESGGLVLGIDGDQHYDELAEEMPPGAAIVLYTDGVVEARRGGELYGAERLDALLAEQRALPARELARVVAEDARAFSGAELADDLAVVVIRRTA
jgi:serine phosphatase RsbU (regulator of sigma subunit)